MGRGVQDWILDGSAPRPEGLGRRLRKEAGPLVGQLMTSRDCRSDRDEGRSAFRSHSASPAGGHKARSPNSSPSSAARPPAISSTAEEIA